MKQWLKSFLQKFKSSRHPNLLKNKTCYLIGAIDRVPDNGAGWRQIMQEVLTKDFGVNVYNPLEKPINLGVEDESERQLRREEKAKGNFDFVASAVRQIRCVDLRMVDKSDFIICYIDTDVHACGTYEELTTANRQKKPIIVFCKQGKVGIPDWIFGMIPHELFFDDIDQVINYLEDVDNGVDKRFAERWVFFDR